MRKDERRYAACAFRTSPVGSVGDRAACHRMRLAECRQHRDGHATPKATATPKVAHAGQSAPQILAGFNAKGLPIGESVTYTDTTDLNHLLGRPGQYIGKVNFKDTRTPDSGNHDVNIAVDDGGSIEVFATAADATNRFTYVQTIATNSALFAEYDYQDGLVVLRVSKILTPAQAQVYQAALQALP
jgi:hypothetical protein